MSTKKLCTIHVTGQVGEGGGANTFDETSLPLSANPDGTVSHTFTGVPAGNQTLELLNICCPTTGTMKISGGNLTLFITVTDS